MKVKALTSFMDLQRRKWVDKGTSFECTDERADHLASLGFVEKVEAKTRKKSVKAK